MNYNHKSIIQKINNNFLKISDRIISVPNFLITQLIMILIPIFISHKIKKITLFILQPFSNNNSKLFQSINERLGIFNVNNFFYSNTNSIMSNNVNKGENFKSTSLALQKARKNGIKLSVMILNGLGGQHYSQQHAIHSAKLVNEIQPEFLSTLVLSYPYGEDHFKQKFNGEFIPLNTIELIAEMKIFIENLNLNNTVFRSDHASNYLILKGNLSRDKNELLSRINGVLDDPSNARLRPEWMRGL